MKKIAVYHGWIIAKVNVEEKFQIFSKEEWSMGEGLRYPNYDDCGSLNECIDNIKGDEN